MNCMAIEAGGLIVVIDCGIGFTQSSHLPPIMCADFRWLLERSDRVAGIVITHGHEDHIGALPHLLADLHVPVFVPAYAMALIQGRLRDYPSLHPDLVPNDIGDSLELGPFTIERFAVHHSIPGSTGLVIQSPAGTIVHSGDFKIERNPVEHQRFDRDRLQEVAETGVRLLLSDSTNATVQGLSGDEKGVRDALSEEITNAPERVVVAMFASNVFRLAHVLEEARRLNRRVCFLGRSVIKHATIAEELGLIRSPQSLIVSKKDAQALSRRNLLIVATGTQGEVQAALGRLAAERDAHMHLEEGDTVLLSSRVIPGNEMAVFNLVSQLERLGLIVRGSKDNPALHVSGHAARDELAELIGMVEPQTFIPVHGTYAHLKAHAELARDQGVPDVLQIQNGDVVKLTPDELSIVERVDTARLYIDGTRIVDPRSIDDRKSMMQAGAVFVTIDGKAYKNTRVRCRGVLAPTQHEDLEAMLKQAVVGALSATKNTDIDEISATAERAVAKCFSRRRMRVPMIDVMRMDEA